MYILDFSPNPKAMSKPIKVQLEYTFQECKGFCALKQEVTSAVAVNITMVFKVWLELHTINKKIAKLIISQQ